MQDPGQVDARTCILREFPETAAQITQKLEKCYEALLPQAAADFGKVMQPIARDAANDKVDMAKHQLLDLPGSDLWRLADMQKLAIVERALAEWFCLAVSKAKPAASMETWFEWVSNGSFCINNSVPGKTLTLMRQACRDMPELLEACKLEEHNKVAGSQLLEAMRIFQFRLDKLVKLQIQEPQIVVKTEFMKVLKALDDKVPCRRHLVIMCIWLVSSI